MPQFRAVRAFGEPNKGPYGHVRAGMVVTMSAQEAAKFNRPHPKSRPILVPHTGPAVQEPLQPGDNKGIPGAPQHSDDDHDDGHGEDDLVEQSAEGEDGEGFEDVKADEGDGGGKDGSSRQTQDQVDRRGGGTGKQSSVSRRGRVSRRRT